MVTFKAKKSLVVDMMPEAVTYLRDEKIQFNNITLDQADEASKVNSKAMVLMSFIKNEQGYYAITVKDKEFYRYTQKLLKETFRARITDLNQKERTVTAEVDHLGHAIDIIEILALKYNLSIVQ
jgi:hypothetical protein